jgi:hypothetical protein
VFGPSAPGNENPEAVTAAMDRAELEHRRRRLIALRNLDFPVHVAHGRSGRLVGWGSHGRGETSSVSVDHGDPSRLGPALQVETEREGYAFESESTLARRALECLLYERTFEWPQRSQAGLAVWLRHDERAPAGAAMSTVTQCAISIEGESAVFQRAGTESCWAAARRHDDLVLTVSARDIPVTALVLIRLDDPIGWLVDRSPAD